MKFNIDGFNRLVTGIVAMIANDREKDRLLGQANQRIATLEQELANLRQESGAQSSDVESANNAIADAQAFLDNSTRTTDAVETLVQGPELPVAPPAPAQEEAPAIVAGEQPVEAPVLDETDRVEFVPAAEADEA